MKLVHRTTANNAKTIFARGFTDAPGSFGTRGRYTGVLLTSQPVDVNEIDITLIEVELDLDEDALAAYERREKGHRDWLVPAVLVNAHMNPRIFARSNDDSE